MLSNFGCELKQFLIKHWKCLALNGPILTLWGETLCVEVYETTTRQGKATKQLFSFNS
jgi:hypothetical protein